MPMDRRRYRKLIHNLNMEARRLFWAVTVLSIGLSKRGDLYRSALDGDRRLARK